MRRVLAFLILSLLLLMPYALAHPGRTDGSGGHRDHSTGEYHYHCGGFPAHQHVNGVCPYANQPTATPRASTSSSSSSLLTRSYKVSTRTPTPKPSPTPASKKGSDYMSDPLGLIFGIILAPMSLLVIVYPFYSLIKDKKKAKRQSQAIDLASKAREAAGISFQVHTLQYAEALNNYRLRLYFSCDNAEGRVFDCYPLLSKPSFAPLANPGMFKNFKIINGDMIMWSCKVGIASDRLFNESIPYHVFASRIDAFSIFSRTPPPIDTVSNPYDGLKINWRTPSDKR